MSDSTIIDLSRSVPRWRVLLPLFRAFWRDEWGGALPNYRWRDPSMEDADIDRNYRRHRHEMLRAFAAGFAKATETTTGGA